jgi:hypothetical protein
MIANGKEVAYRTVPDGAYYYGMTLVDGGTYRLMMWNDLLGVEGTDREVKMTFRLHDVIVRGSGLLQLIRDAKRHKIDVLTVAPRSQSMMAGEGLVVTELEISAAK